MRQGKVWVTGSSGQEQMVPETLASAVYMDISGGQSVADLLLAANLPNVRAFGAKGDGVADDTAAINSCMATIGNQGVVFFPPGTYRTTGIEVSDKDSLRMLGAGAVIKLAENAAKPLMRIKNCPRLHMEGLTLDGNKAAQTAELDALVLMHVYFSIINNCRIVNAKRDGLQVLTYTENGTFMGGDELHVAGCFIQSNGRHGVLVDSIADTNIDNNNIEFNGGNGMLVRCTSGVPSGNMNITNNQILSNDLIGIECMDDTARTVISQNHIRNNGGVGLRYVGGTQYLIANNNIHLNGRLYPYSAGVLIGYNGKGIVSGNHISCTHFSPTQGYGIALYYSSDVTVLGNVMADNLSAGIYTEGCSNIKIKTNIGANDN